MFHPSRKPSHRHLGYTYDVEIDTEPGEVHKIMAHYAMRDGQIIFQTPQPTYSFLTALQFRNFVNKMERATR